MAKKTKPKKSTSKPKASVKKVKKAPAKKASPKKVTKAKVAKGSKKTKSIKVLTSNSATVISPLPPATLLVETVSTVKEEAPRPTRAPMRKIIGEGNVITIGPIPTVVQADAQEGSEAETTPVAEEHSESAPINEINFSASVVKRVLPEAPAIKISWNEVPRNIPNQIKFLVSLAQKECEHAADWPFPFAKFISSLPSDICGLGFSLALMNLDHEYEQISQLTAIESDVVEATVLATLYVMGEKFSNDCPEIYRKWATQRTGTTIGVDVLLERYLVGKVDKNFQCLLGEVLLKAIASRTLFLDEQLDSEHSRSIH